MEHLTMREQVRFYLQWCNDNHKRPQEFASLQEYLSEIGGLITCN